MAMIQHYFKLPVETFTLPSVPLVQILGKKPKRWNRWGLREKLRRFSVKENGVSRKGAEIQLGEGVPEELVPLSSGEKVAMVTCTEYCPVRLLVL